MKRFYLFSAIIILCINNAAFAFEGGNLTLELAQHMALQNHPQIRSGTFSLSAAEQDVKAARARYFPKVSGNIVGAYADNGTQIEAGDGLTNSSVLRRGAYGVSVSQLITDFGRTKNQIESVTADLEARSAKVENTRQRVLFDVTRAYYNALRAQALEQVADDTLKARSDFLEQVTALREAGRRSDLDVSIAKQDVSDAQLLKLQAKNGVNDAAAILSQALGLAKVEHFALVPEKNVLSPPADIDRIIAQALELNPELLTLKARALAARKTADSDYAANYPTISALAYAGEVPYDPTGLSKSGYAAAGINLSIPIFEGGRIMAVSKSADYIAESAREDVIDKQNSLSKDIRVAWNNVKVAYENIDVVKQLLENASVSLDLTSARYELGRSSIVDLAQAQLAKTKAEITNTNAVYEYLTQRAFLNYTAGYPLGSS
ncbi:MAG TPA: TolC family protein [Nitrospiria bacterium]|nr:TolC family protein [Nitrospiria bacterium]